MHGSCRVAPPGVGAACRSPSQALLNIAVSSGCSTGCTDSYLRVPAERFHRAINHGLPADGAVLLRPARASAKPAAGGDDDGGSTL